jgi:hypothetical protein
MLKKRNDGDLPVPFEPGEGLADQPITRARAIKLAGATVAAGAFAAFMPDAAEARPNRKGRRRRRRRRRRNVTTTNNTTDNSTVNFGDSLVGTPVTEAVTVTNNGPDSVTLNPTIVGDGFRLVDTDPIIVGAGESRIVEVIFDPLSGGVSTGNLRLVDARDGLVLEDIELLGTGLLP